MDRGIKREGFAVIGVLLFCTMAMQTDAATITVTNTNDSGPGSLRQALAVAHDGDRITFAVSGAITLTSGGLGVTKNVTISGPGANQLSINGNQASFVFAVAFRRTATISGLSITNGGVGIWNQQGTLTVSNCVLSGNSFSGLYNNADQGSSSGASMTVANSIISNNSGTGAANVFPFQFDASGGGCACMTITDSVVSNNADGRSTRAIRILRRRRSTTSAAVATIAYSVVAVASTSVQSRHSPSDRVRLPDRGQRRPKQTTVRFNET
jgi:hypothetical protein